MQEEYPFKELESNFQKIWNKNNTFSSKENSNKENIMFCQCSHTQVANFIWAMSGTIQ